MAPGYGPGGARRNAAAWTVSYPGREPPRTRRLAEFRLDRVNQIQPFPGEPAVGVGFDGGFVFPAFLPGYDAVMGLSVLLELMASTGRSLADVVRSLPQVHIARGVVPTPWEEKGTVMRQLIEKSAGREQVLLDGVKLEHDDGWVLCLPDPEEPATRIWAEGSNPRAAQTLVDEYSRRIRQLARD